MQKVLITMKIWSLSYNFLFGLIVGLCSWGWQPIGLATISLFVFLEYFYTKSRLYFFVFVLGYYLAATRGMLFGANVYFDGIFYGLMAWTADALLVSVAYILFWSDKRRTISFVVTMIIIIIPPIGFFEWVNPIFATGAIFPYAGFFGFVLLLCGVIALSRLERKKAFLTLGGIAILATLLNGAREDNIYPEISPIDTNFGQLYKDQIDDVAAYRTQNRFLREVKKADKDIVLLPETALGWWNENNMLIWQNLPDNKTVIAGASIFTDATIGQSDNVVLVVTNEGYDVAYKQRVPIPISMWKFWGNTGARAHYFDDDRQDTVDIGGKRVAVFLCYEQLLPLLYVQSLRQKPDFLLGISNLWWNVESSGENIQRAKMNLISRLYDIPFVFAVNRKEVGDKH